MHYYLIFNQPLEFENELDSELYPHATKISQAEYNLAYSERNEPKTLTNEQIKEGLRSKIHYLLSDTDKCVTIDRADDLSNQNEFVEYRLTLRKILYNWQDLTLEQINSLIPVKPTEQRKALPNII